MSVRNAILGLLDQRPRHGYELHQAFEALVGGKQNWDVKPAQIYMTLTRLEEAGLVAEHALEQDGGPEKRVYQLTPAGRASLAEWFESPVQSQPQRDEFFLKLLLSLGAGRASAQRVISIQRGHLFRQLHRLTERREDCDPSLELAHILLLDQATMHLEADLRWLDMIEARLDDIARQPLPEPEARPRGRPRREA
jgi:DNA-binding PadR family transcriptional regulator